MDYKDELPYELIGGCRPVDGVLRTNGDLLAKYLRTRSALQECDLNMWLLREWAEERKGVKK